MNRLLELRTDRDLYQKDIANFLNITQRNYSYIETGKSDIPTQILVDLAVFYNTSVDYILGITNVFTPYPRNNFRNEV